MNNKNVGIIMNVSSWDLCPHIAPNGKISNKDLFTAK